VFYIFALKSYGAARGLFQKQNKLGNGCFTASRFTGDTETIASGNGKTDIVHGFTHFKLPADYAAGIYRKILFYVLQLEERFQLSITFL
jgi:hypothetical protein